MNYNFRVKIIDYDNPTFTGKPRIRYKEYCKFGQAVRYKKKEKLNVIIQGKINNHWYDLV